MKALRLTLALLLPLCVLALVAKSFFHRNAPKKESKHPIWMGAYIWQKRWTPEVCDAVANADSLLNELCIEAAEISKKDGRPNIQRSKIDWATLASSHCKIGLAWRIGVEVIDH